MSPNVTARLCIGSATSDELLQRRSMYRVSTQRTVSVVSALATLTLLAGLVQQSSSTTAPNKLLLLLVDGFGWDYFDKFSSDQLSGFTRLRQNSVAVEAFVPAFPSESFTNYYSILTGNRMIIIMRPSSLGGGRTLRRTLSVRLSVCPSVRPSRYRQRASRRAT